MPKAATTPPRPVARSGAKREHEVLAAATKVFYERGYAEASIQDIANELGILKGSLYHYIASKEDLLLRLLERTQQEVGTILDEVIALDGLTPLARLREYFGRQATYTMRNIEVSVIYYRGLELLSDVPRRDLTRRRRVHERFVVELIEAGQAAGEIDPSVDPELSTRLLFGATLWIYRWYRPGGRVSAARVLAELDGLITRSLAVRSA
jgi:AcrR family transcriptional regulator